MGKYLEVSTWTEAELALIPTKETDEYEYKSSKIANQVHEKYKQALKEKLQKAASAFWNSGGGYFIVGYDETTGQVDGGIPEKMGTQDIRDWIDNALHEVEPVAKYTTKLIEPETPTSLINSGNVVLVIGFAQSFHLPHMSTDNKYYIRAGANTVPAKHFIVEALRTLRSQQKPLLSGLIRRHPEKPEIAELVVTCLNQVPAININLDLLPRPERFVNDTRLPLRIPFIDSQYPFRTDLKIAGNPALYGDYDVYLILEYEDLQGLKFTHRQLLDDKQSILDSLIKISNPNDMENLVKRLADDIGWFKGTFQNRILPPLVDILTSLNSEADE